MLILYGKAWVSTRPALLPAGTTRVSGSFSQSARGSGVAQKRLPSICAEKTDRAKEDWGRTQLAVGYHLFGLVTAAVYVVLLLLYFKLVRRYLK